MDKEDNENKVENEVVAGVEEKEEISSIKKLYQSWIEKDKEKLKIAFEELQKEETVNSKKIKNEAFYYNLLYQLGEDSTRNFETIENKAQGTEVFGEVMSMIANAYGSTHNYEIAKLYYEKGLKNHRK